MSQMKFGSIYYHYDKTDSISTYFTNTKKGDKFIITGSQSLNAFPMGFINSSLSESEVTNRLMPYELYKEICNFIKCRDLRDIDKIIIDCKKHVNDWYKERIFREIIFERVRLDDFCKLPSRFSCIFLSNTKNNLDHWISKIPKENEIFDIYEFESQDPSKFKPLDPPVEEVIHKADAKWLENNYQDIEKIHSNATQYWTGTLTNESLVEILYFGILKVVNQERQSHQTIVPLDI